MPLVKSLICTKGFDNGRRFLVISLSCYLLFILLAPILTKATILLVLLLLLATPLLAASGIRRMRDAGFAIEFAAVSVTAYWFTVFGIIYLGSGAGWLLLLPAGMVIFAMATISNARIRRNRDYIMGYSGPIDLEIKASANLSHHQHGSRIEPIVAMGHSEEGGQADLLAKQPDNTRLQDNIKDEAQDDIDDGWERKLGDWIIANRQLSVIIALVISILIISVITWSAYQQEAEDIPESAKSDKGQAATTLAEPPIRLNKIEMPDGFWVMLNQYDAVTIGWQGDRRSDGEFWSAVTALGDSDCVEVRFNSRETFRSMKVTVKNFGDYYADFSPVDSQKIIQAIALRDRFKLCGYEFSLKGTQAKLMNNKKYASYFDEDE